MQAIDQPFEVVREVNRITHLRRKIFGICLEILIRHNYYKKHSEQFVRKTIGVHRERFIPQSIALLFIAIFV
jgi:hypothetical protein